MSSSQEDPIIIYALAGSQFVFKVLSALTARKISHHVQLVPLDEKKRVQMIPSGGKLVPEMKVGDDTIVTGSEDILHWMDDNRNTNYFPNDLASELSVRASDKTLAAMVWYYNWVDDEGYARSMRESIKNAVLPSFFCLFRNQIVDFLLSSERKKFAPKVVAALDIQEDVLNDEPHMRNLLIDELKYFQSFLSKPSSEQPFLLPGSEATAADFSVYAQVQRLIGNESASDVPIAPALPELKNSDNELERLWEWYDLMRERFPVQFKGKRPPRQSE